jgi:hypothetical protein
MQFEMALVVACYNCFTAWKQPPLRHKQAFFNEQSAGNIF